MIKLYQFPAGWGIPNASPFCVKVETYLRMTNQEFEIVPAMDPSKAPKGKFPYIEDGDKKIGDSTFIIEYLQATYGDPLDAELTHQEKAQSITVQRLLEDHLYWGMLYSRWGDERTWPVIKEQFFSGLPKPLQMVVPKQVRKAMLNEIHEQGLGHHQQNEIYHLTIQDIDALASLLGDNRYMLGEQPHAIDACVYGFVVNLLYPPIETEIYLHARQHKNLFQYCENMRVRYFE